MVSVITISYNSKNTIQQTFESVLCQSYNKPFEYLVIDGGSIDGTKEIIIGYEKRFVERGISFRWKSESDKGIYDAMNKGIRMSSGEIIGLLNSDDYYEPDALQNVVLAMEQHPNVDIYYGFIRILMTNGDELQVYRYCYENYLAKIGSGCESAAQHPTCFIRRALYSRIGLYSLEFKTASDYEFLIRAKLNGAIFWGINAIITNYRNNGASSKIDDYERMDQRMRTHYMHKLITEDEFNRYLNRLKYIKYKIFKRKLINLIFGKSA